VYPEFQIHEHLIFHLHSSTNPSHHIKENPIFHMHYHPRSLNLHHDPHALSQSIPTGEPHQRRAPQDGDLPRQYLDLEGWVALDPSAPRFLSTGRRRWRSPAAGDPRGSNRTWVAHRGTIPVRGKGSSSRYAREASRQRRGGARQGAALGDVSGMKGKISQRPCKLENGRE
jgi:hypothetical protein